MQSLKDFFKREKININLLIAVLTIFLAVFSISKLVEISNNVKEGRYIGQDINVKNTISVSGTGEVFASPDLALVNFSVITEKRNVAEAMSENTRKMNKIIEELENEGIDEKDLKTVQFNIYPRYDYINQDNFLTSRRVLAGYEIYQALEVKIRDLTKIGEIIEKATQAGSNQVGNLIFTIDSQNELKNEARGKAIEEAKEKADKIADKLGVKLVRIVNFSENSYTPNYDLMRSEAIGGSAPDIQTGESKVQVSVNISYEIN